VFHLHFILSVHKLATVRIKEKTNGFKGMSGPIELLDAAVEITV
jgi:hypothetical protein